MEQQQHSPHVAETQIRVRYAETDRMGRVYQANYFVWFEVGRTEMFRQFAGRAYREVEEQGLYLPATECHCNYYAPADYDDLLTIRTWVGELGKVRVRIEYEIVNATTGARLASGHTIHAFTSKEGKILRLRDLPTAYEAMARTAGVWVGEQIKD